MVARVLRVSYRGTGMSAGTSTSRVPPTTFDSVILAAVVAECQDLVGARVQRVHQTGPVGLAIVLRGGRVRTLLASIHPRWGRLHLARHVEPAEAAPFAQQARSRLEGATLRSVTAPAFERIAVCGFDTLEGPMDLVIEIMGRHSNLILCADGVIAGAMKVIGEDRSRVRPVLPHRSYKRPPQPRPDPETIAAADLAEAAARAASGDQPAWRTMLQAVAGIGPALATEVCVRAGADPNRPLGPVEVAAAISALRSIAELVRARRFSPVLYRDAGGSPVAYAAFPLQIYQALQPASTTMSAAVEDVAARAVGVAAIDDTRAALSAIVTQATERVRRTLAAVDEDTRAASGAARAREFGELILAYLSHVAPGAAVLEVPDFQGQSAQIPLDPSRSGLENAQAYFRRHSKAQAALKRLPVRRAQLEAEGAFLESTATAIAQADSLEDLWEVEQDLIAAGLRRRARAAARPKAVTAGRTFDLAGGQVVRVGRSARENDSLTFEVAGPGDLWLHARGMPGAHVILQAHGGQPGEAMIETAARIAAYYSAGRASGKVPVVITRRRFVRRVRGGRPGQVTYTNERAVTVSPGLPERVQGHPSR